MTSSLNHIITGGDRESALFLIHPLGADLTFWDDFVAAVDGRATTIACDLRGVGGSPPAQRPVGLAEHAADIEALRQALGVRTISPVGCAVSTMSAAFYAARHPERTHALVLANPTPSSAPQARAMLTERAALVRAAGMAAVLPGAVERAFLDLPHDESYDRYMKRFSEQSPDAYALALLAAAEADASEALAAVGGPVLLVPGRHDVLLPMERAQAVAALVPQARMVVMDDAAHFVPYQQPAAFAELVLEFVGRAAAAPSRAPECQA